MLSARVRVLYYQSGYGGMNARDDVIPLARVILPKQAGGRIPWAVVAIEQPAPVGNELQQDPDRLAQRAGEMSDRGVTEITRSTIAMSAAVSEKCLDFLTEME